MKSLLLFYLFKIIKYEISDLYDLYKLLQILGSLSVKLLAELASNILPFYYQYFILRSKLFPANKWGELLQDELH